MVNNFFNFVGDRKIRFAWTYDTETSRGYLPIVFCINHCNIFQVCSYKRAPSQTIKLSSGLHREQPLPSVYCLNTPFSKASMLIYGKVRDSFLEPRFFGFLPLTKITISLNLVQIHPLTLEKTPKKKARHSGGRRKRTHVPPQTPYLLVVCSLYSIIMIFLYLSRDLNLWGNEKMSGETGGS